MNSVAAQTPLDNLSVGDRVTYHGVKWDVTDYSTYSDANGYQTAEWLLRSPGGNEYYLLREVDPQNPETLVNWYLAEEIKEPSIFLPANQNNLAPIMWEAMQVDNTPYPVLRVYATNYSFESQTRGSYEGDEENTSRITWDYWDKDRTRNLALEAWPNGELRVYSSKVVKPEEFSQIEKGVVRQNSVPFPIGQVLLGSGMLIWGLYLLIYG